MYITKSPNHMKIQKIQFLFFSIIIKKPLQANKAFIFLDSYYTIARKSLKVVYSRISYSWRNWKSDYA